MPTIYLSPSTQEKNEYVNTGTEEYWMNRLADALEPYLTASGIDFVRNTPEMTAASSIRASNAGNYDFHLALHSNAAPTSLAGKLRGTDVYYYPGSSDGLRMANLIVEQLKTIYPQPDLVRALSTTAIGEVGKTAAPSVLVEIAYHDNPEDAAWIQNNLDAIARALAKALDNYFGLPFREPAAEKTGTVRLTSGSLNLRSAPSTAASVVGKIPNGASVTVTGTEDGWYAVRYGDSSGYVRSEYVVLD